MKIPSNPFSFLKGSLLLLLLTFASVSAAQTRDLKERGQDLSPRNLVGSWQGTHTDGKSVTYVFGEDGSAQVIVDGQVVMAGDDESTVTWELVEMGDRNGLDMTYSHESGLVSVSRFMVKRIGKGRIKLRSGGDSGRRPDRVKEGADPMQMILSRI